MNQPPEDKKGLGEYICDCPFCGKSVYKALDPKTLETVGVMHTLPMCEQFNKLSPEAFIHAVFVEVTKSGVN